MRYLKLYEDFDQNNIEDILEDIKWIMISLSDDSKIVESIKDGQILIYEVGDYAEDEFRTAKNRLMDIGYKFLNNYSNKIVIAKIDIPELEIGKEYYIDYGGYDFNIALVESAGTKDSSFEFIDNTIVINYKLVKGGEVEILSKDNTILDIESAYDDPDIGWEIKLEIKDILFDLFKDILQIERLITYKRY